MTSYMKSTEFGLSVLNLFSIRHAEWGVSEISRKLHRNKGTVSRMLSTLSEGGMILKVETTGKYRLGPKVIELAAVFLSKVEVRTVALPYLEELRQQTDETVSVFVVFGEHRICIERIESGQDMKVSVRIGEPLPLHAGASGKLLLAYMPTERRREVLTKVGLPKLTPQTLVSKKDLDKELREIRKQGFAHSSGERMPLITSISAPIYNHEGKVVAAIATAGPSARFTPKKKREYIRLTKEAGEKVSRDMGYLTRLFKHGRTPSLAKISNQRDSD